MILVHRQTLEIPREKAEFHLLLAWKKSQVSMFSTGNFVRLDRWEVSELGQDNAASH